jgi:hypothetical protein
MPLTSTPVTQLLGVNDHKVAVGFENDPDNSAHGFVYSIATGQATFTNIPNSSSVTDAGINDKGDLVGFYTDANGNTDGMLVTPNS